MSPPPPPDAAPRLCQFPVTGEGLHAGAAARRSGGAAAAARLRAAGGTVTAAAALRRRPPAAASPLDERRVRLTRGRALTAAATAGAAATSGGCLNKVVDPGRPRLLSRGGGSNSGEGGGSAIVNRAAPGSSHRRGRPTPSRLQPSQAERPSRPSTHGSCVLRGVSVTRWRQRWRLRPPPATPTLLSVGRGACHRRPAACVAATAAELGVRRCLTAARLTTAAGTPSPATPPMSRARRSASDGGLRRSAPATAATEAHRGSEDGARSACVRFPPRPW